MVRLRYSTSFRATVRTACMLCVSLFWGVPPCLAQVSPDHPLRNATAIEPRDTALLPQAELLASPEVRVLLGYTRRPLHFPDGHTLGLFSFSHSAPANWLFLIDARDLSFQRLPIPDNDIGSHGAALMPNGDVYLMPYGNSRAHHLFTAENRWETFPLELPKDEYVWDALGASNGRVYFGTYPNAIFGEYDPATGKTETWPQVAPETTYVNTFREEGGKIHFRAWGPGEAWTAFDPVTRVFSPSALPVESPAPVGAAPPPEGETAWATSIEAGGRVFAISNPSGTLWELPKEGAPILRGGTGFPAEPVWWLKAVEGSLAGVSYFGGMFHLDLGNNTFRTAQLDNRAPGGNSIMFLETITPDCIIGANYSQQNLFAVNPASGAVRVSEAVIARTSGEPMCAVGFGGKAYVGIYTDSLISRYDPAIPFSYGKNPQELIALGHQYEQTRPRAAVTDGRLVYISSDSAYSKLGGALAVIDPATDGIDVYHHLIKDQNLPTLAWDGKNGLLWGGTDRWGQMRSHPPTQSGALIYAFDPNTRTVRHTLDLWPGADVVSVCGVSPEGFLVATANGEVAIIHAASQEVLFKGAFPVSPAMQLRRGADGGTYCLSVGVLYRWDFTENRLTPLAACNDARYVTEAAPGVWVFATPTTLYRWKEEQRNDRR